jgi:hypothetical protein
VRRLRWNINARGCPTDDLGMRRGSHGARHHTRSPRGARSPGGRRCHEAQGDEAANSSRGHTLSRSPVYHRTRPPHHRDDECWDCRRSRSPIEQVDVSGTAALAATAGSGPAPGLAGSLTLLPPPPSPITVAPAPQQTFPDPLMELMAGFAQVGGQPDNFLLRMNQDPMILELTGSIVLQGATSFLHLRQVRPAVSLSLAWSCGLTRQSPPRTRRLCQCQ